MEAHLLWKYIVVDGKPPVRLCEVPCLPAHSIGTAQTVRFAKLVTVLFLLFFQILPVPCVQMSLSETIIALKQKIAPQAGVFPELQRLIHKGRVLKEDNSTLDSYGEE